MVQLSNGLKTVFVTNPGLQSVGISFTVAYGQSQDFTLHDLPYAHFIEHGLHAGTKTKKCNEPMTILEDLAVTWNASTNNEYANFYAHAPKAFFEPILEVLSDMLVNSTFPKKGVEVHRKFMINEYNDLQNPQDRFLNEFNNELLKGHPVSKDRLFAESELKQMSRDTLFEIYRDQFTPDNTFLAIYGNFNRAEVMRLVEKNLAGFSGTAKKVQLAGLDMNQKAKEIVVRKGDEPDSSLAIIGLKRPYHLISNLKEDENILMAVNLLSAKLNKTIRENGEGAAYDFDAGQFSGLSFGQIMVHAKTKINTHQKIYRLLTKEIDNMKAGEIGQVEFEKMKSKQLATRLLFSEDTMSFANNLGSDYAIYGDPFYTVKRGERVLREMTLDDVRSTSKYFDMDKALVCRLLPKR